MKKVSANGIRLAVYEWSQQGEAVIFLHFMNGFAHVWNGVVPFFTEQYRAIGIDLRGHGQSDAPESGYDLATMSGDVLGVMDELRIERAHFVGSSLGCEISVWLAAYHPERVLSIALSDGALYDMAEPNGESVSLDVILTQNGTSTVDAEYDSVEAFVNGLKAHYGEKWNVYRERATYEGIVHALQPMPNGKWVCKPTKALVKQMITALHETRHEPLYARIKCPVLFLPAAKHRFFDAKNEFIARVRKLLSSTSKVVILPNTEHNMLYDFPEEVSRAVLAFYREY